MERFNKTTSKYNIQETTRFKHDYKKIKKQNKNITKLAEVIFKIANGQTLEEKYKNHKLVDDKSYKNCYECHIEPDWLLVYKIEEDKLILLLSATGSHSDLFNN